MITGTEAEYQPDVGSTKDTPYLALTGEQWGAICEKNDRVITALHCIHIFPQNNSARQELKNILLDM